MCKPPPLQHIHSSSQFHPQLRTTVLFSESFDVCHRRTFLIYWWKLTHSHICYIHTCCGLIQLQRISFSTHLFMFEMFPCKLWLFTLLPHSSSQQWSEICSIPGKVLLTQRSVTFKWVLAKSAIWDLLYVRHWSNEWVVALKMPQLTSCLKMCSSTCTDIIFYSFCWSFFYFLSLFSCSVLFCSVDSKVAGFVGSRVVMTNERE